MLGKIIRTTTLVGLISIVGDNLGKRYPDLYNQYTLAEIDRKLDNSWKYGTGIKLMKQHYYESSLRNHPLIIEEYLDNDHNSLYISYALDHENDELMIQITRDFNENGRIDGKEIAFEMTNIDSKLDDVERISIQWWQGRKFRHAINRSYFGENKSRFKDADRFFRKIMDQREKILERKKEDFEI